MARQLRVRARVRRLSTQARNTGPSCSGGRPPTRSHPLSTRPIAAADQRRPPPPRRLLRPRALIRVEIGPRRALSRRGKRCSNYVRSATPHKVVGPVRRSVIGEDTSTPSAHGRDAIAPTRLLPWTAMKEGLLGGTLVVSPRSESEEARLDVARWAGFESPEDRCVPAVVGRRDRRRVGLATGRRRAARACGPRLDVGCAGARGGRVDERRAVGARPSRRARLGRVDRRRDQGQGLGAAGVQDRQDRCSRAGHAVGPRSCARDLAARPVDPSGARARALSPAPGSPSHHAEEPHPCRVDRLRSPVPGLRPLRPRRPRPAGPPAGSPTRGGPTSMSASP
jgi:hypothetical protein